MMRNDHIIKALREVVNELLVAPRGEPDRHHAKAAAIVCIVLEEIGSPEELKENQDYFNKVDVLEYACQEMNTATKFLI